MSADGPVQGRSEQVDPPAPTPGPHRRMRLSTPGWIPGWWLSPWKGARSTVRRTSGRIVMTGNTMTSMVSAAAFVVLAAVVALAPVPFVSWAPGRTVDLAGDNTEGQPMITLGGLPTTPLHGELRMTTVSVTRIDSQLSLPEAAVSYWMPKRDVLPREVVYPPAKSVEQVRAEDVAMMGSSQREALVAALRAAGQPVLELPMVVSVVVSGPSNGKLQPGDLILEVDDVAVQSVDDVRSRIRKHQVGEPVVFTVERNGAPHDVTLTTAPGPKDKAVPYLGISLDLGHKHAATVSYGIDPAIVGPSAGLVFSLAIYDMVSETDLLAGHNVAGTGTISADGTVGPIGGIQEKVAGAERAGAEVFLVPAGNCGDVDGLRTDLRLVKVATLREAISALQKINQNDAEGVSRC